MHFSGCSTADTSAGQIKASPLGVAHGSRRFGDNVVTADGAVYTPPVVIVPTVAFPPCTPPTSQFTAVFVVPVTAAVKSCFAPKFTVASIGEMLIPTAACAPSVTDALPCCVRSNSDVAVTVTTLLQATFGRKN